MSMNESKPRHPIRVVAQRTGLTPATLRAWERRYGAVSPGRSDAGQRLYSDHDVSRLSLLRDLTEAGRSIGSVASLTEAEAQALVEEDRAHEPPTGALRATDGVPLGWLTGAYQATLELDSIRLERLLRGATLALGADRFLEEVIVPLLVQIGDEWTRERISPAQEHMASGVIERALQEVTPIPMTGGRPVMIVSTLPGERHALGARLVAAVAGLEGWQTTYLGPDLPVPEVVRSAQTIDAAAVAISVVHGSAEGGQADDVRELRTSLPPSVDLLVGGRAALGLFDSGPVPDGVRVLYDLNGVREYCRAR